MFPHVRERTVLECYRAHELLVFEKNPRQKKTMKTQKDVFQKTENTSPTVYNKKSVYIGQIEPIDNIADPSKGYRNSHMKIKRKKVNYNICACNEDVPHKKYKAKYRDKTWDSITNMYGGANTTEVWPDPKKEKLKSHRDTFEMKNPVIDINYMSKEYANRNKKQKRKSKTHKKRGHNKTQIISKDIDQQSYPTIESPAAVNAPVISLFRKQDKTLNEKSKFKKKRKSKDASTEDLSVIPQLGEICSEGPCSEAVRKNKSFICKCVNRKREPDFITEECTDANCRSSRNSSNINGVLKLKDRILCVCNKYSQKIVNMTPYNTTCRQGPCNQTPRSHKYNFICKCGESHEMNECYEQTCGKYTRNINVNNKDIVNKDRISAKSKISKNTKKMNDFVIKKEHESEQTGEPFFEIQVNPRDMCVLNPIEIKENIIKYGRPEKNEAKCICPSRGRLKSGEICKSGACKKAYKNKQMNFNCWCEKKIAECGDTTCDVIDIGNLRKKQKKSPPLKQQRLNKPLLEMQLDMDKMCVVNPKEIEDKILNNITVDDICSSGVCRDAALEHKIPYFCRCIRKKINSEITECTKDTCIDVNQKKKSKFSLFCTRICSKSENWSYRDRNKTRDQKRIKRRSFYEISPNKLCKGRICTQSDNLRKKAGLYSNIMDLKHLPACDCQECKNRLKPLKPREKFISGQEIIPKKDTIKKDVNKNDHMYNMKDHVFPRPLSRAREIKPYNSNKVKHTQISNELKHKTTCECDSDSTYDLKTERKKEKFKQKLEKKKLARKRRSKKVGDRNAIKYMKQRAKYDRKTEMRARKERRKEIKMMQKKMNEEPLEKNFCTAFLLGILKIGIQTIILAFSVIYTIIRKPKRSAYYVLDRIKDPEGTCHKIRKWLADAFIIKKLQIAETVRGSDTLTILGDHFLDSAFYQSLADKGKTKKEQALFEQKSKARKRRIRKREQQAIFSCRHMLLTTLRNTPFLWVYHICPNFYPQCLGLLSFMRSFSRILMFLIAFACWTPCILSFELCRACLCCFMCTG